MQAAPCKSGYNTCMVDSVAPTVGETYKALSEHRTPPYAPIELVEGEKVTFLPKRSPWPSYGVVVKANGAAGWMPIRLLSLDRPLATVRQAYSTAELKVNYGDMLTVLSHDEVGGWVRCKSDRGEGWVPQSVIGFS